MGAALFNNFALICGADPASKYGILIKGKYINKYICIQMPNNKTVPSNVLHPNMPLSLLQIRSLCLFCRSRTNMTSPLFFFEHTPGFFPFSTLIFCRLLMHMTISFQNCYPQNMYNYLRKTLSSCNAQVEFLNFKHVNISPVREVHIEVEQFLQTIQIFLVLFVNKEYLYNQYIGQNKKGSD